MQFWKELSHCCLHLPYSKRHSVHRTRTEVPHKHWNALGVDSESSPSLTAQTTLSAHCFSEQMPPAQSQDWTSRWHPSLCSDWQYKVLGCQKSVNIWAWIGGLKAITACREREQQWSASCFLPGSPTASLPAWSASSWNRKHCATFGDCSESH